MAFDAFLKVDGIPGESADDKHKGWIEVESFDLCAEQPVSNVVSTAGGASAGRVEHHDFVVRKLIDKSTPKLFDACNAGKHIKEIILELCRAGGDKQKYLEIKMEQVMISKFNPSTWKGADFPSEEVHFNYGKIVITYIQQKRDDGTAAGNIAAGWDLTTNKATA
jgi:type VI secretion system secreted protein Hcp